MSRLDDIRESHTYPTAESMPMRAQWADESIGYLLDLVERAVPFVECKTFPDANTTGALWQRQRLEWLRDVRGGEGT